MLFFRRMLTQVTTGSLAVFIHKPQFRNWVLPVPEHVVLLSTGGRFSTLVHVLKVGGFHAIMFSGDFGDLSYHGDFKSGPSDSVDDYAGQVP